MLIPRVIPCLLLQGESFVKTIRFRKRTYLGDPINIINIFNRFEVDEMCVLDIDATVESRNPNLRLLRHLAEECWVPLAFGGGVNNLKQIEEIFQIGVEKVVINSAAVRSPGIVEKAAREFGTQSIVVSIDVVRRVLGRDRVVIDGGRKRTGLDPVVHARRVGDLGAGEILLNSIQRDGMMEGYDIDLVRRVTDAVEIPVIALGGAGTRSDLLQPLRDGGASAVAAGSLFVYQGRRLRGVLVNFPERPILERLLQEVAI